MDLSNITPKQIEEFYSNKSKEYYRKFTTNQLRNFFSEIVSIRTYYRSNPKDSAKIELRLRKLKAMLVYAEGKQTGRTDLKELR
ncbi:MAG: type III-A CRISPR-associated protein Csm2, partial [Candidatus Kapaibacteriales bacterium]